MTESSFWTHFLLQLAFAYAGWRMYLAYTAELRKKDNSTGVPRLILKIPGTKAPAPGTVSPKVMASHGIPPSKVLHVAIYDAPETDVAKMPDSVKDCLEWCYDRGNTRGPDVARVLKQGRNLGAAEALYFVLVETGSGEPEIFAFVGETPSLRPA